MAAIYYRPEIDGLRAIAVLAVLIYHAGFSFLPGGFMGVDIFFVISGFLITSFIVADINAGTFSMVGFWERRARRILPPLFAVVAATFIVGWFLFLPFDYVQLGKEMAAQSVFGSNILFLLQGGYFDDGDGFKALLHTWSLAIEEQFYLFYPIGMVLFARFISKKFFYLILPVAVLSFAFCLIMTNMSDRVAFYALPFRGWELLAGAIVAVSRPLDALKNWQREMLAALGFILMLGALIFYKNTFAFPGWFALLPVLGASLVIWSGGATFIAKILSVKPMVAVGLISYSLYLWHWPILVYARYIPLYEFNTPIALGCIAASFILAALTWKFIEQPVRHRKILSSRKSIFLVSLVGLLAMVSIGGAIIAAKGIPGRFDPAVRILASGKNDVNPMREQCDQPSLERVQQGAVCSAIPSGGNPSYLLWGDSMADSIAPVFYHLSDKTGHNGKIITAHGCPPILDGQTAQSFGGFNCRDHNRAVFDLIAREKISKVFLAGSWRNYLQPGQMTFEAPDNDVRFGGNATMAALQNTIDRLQDMGVSVFVIYNPPYTPLDPPRALALARQFEIEGDPSIPMMDYQDNLNLGIQLFRDLSEDKDVTYIELQSQLCRDHVCPMGEGRSWYFNPGHLSMSGALRLEPLLSPFFD